ncbi:hypothetical protein ABZ714_30945 [Streptomyces sp. NPDC006798]|uniref:hypothetical protein n=1 Tax=Streptomyces sp. NPDC006798 TaxID=3155462 RepID=UPI0033EAC8DF
MNAVALGPAAGTPVSRATALRRAVRFHWCHLAALRSTWILLAVVAAFGLLAGAATPLEVENGEAPTVWSVVTGIQLDAVSLQLPLAALLLLPLATGPVTTEFGRGAARTTWLTLADRRTAYQAKLLLGGAIGAVAALGGALLTGLAGMAALAVGGYDQPDWGRTVPGVLGYVLFMACWPVIATATAVLVRDRVATALLLVLWPLIGERLAGLLLRFVPGLGGITDWLPFAAGRAALAAGSHLQPEDGRAMTDALVGSGLSPAAGAAVLLAFTAVLAYAGLRAYRAGDGG